jgi:hypothetical protein
MMALSFRLEGSFAHRQAAGTANRKTLPAGLGWAGEPDCVADSQGWIALLNRSDQYHVAARKVMIAFANGHHF